MVIMTKQRTTLYSLLLRNFWAGTAIVTLAVMRIATTPTANLSHFLLAAYALLGRAQAIQALALSWLFTMFNPGIAAEATAGSVGRYAVLLAAAASVFLRSWRFRNRIKVRPATLATLLLGLFFVVHSWFFSSMVDVSVLKAVSWALAMCTLIAAWAGLTADERETVARSVFGGLIVVMLVSLPLLLLPVGYLRNGTGFQGVLNHPQAFGPAMALLGAWSVGHLLGKKRPSWLQVVLAGLCLILVVLSETRTAGLALALGVGLAVLFAPGLAGQPVRVVLPGLRSKRTLVVAGVALAGMLVAGARLENAVTHFITKSGRGSAGTILGAYESSRGMLVEAMWSNIKVKPLQGIGFGIASDPLEMQVERDPVLGLPVSAAVEKGVLPVAVLEEVGLVGFLAVALWVFMLMRRSARGGLVPVTVGLTALLMNMGEATLFSPGGMGLLSLILFGWAFASGQARR
jgi:hypothetical protein